MKASLLSKLETLSERHEEVSALLGDNVLSIRLPAAFLGLFVVALTMRWAKRSFDPATGIIAGTVESAALPACRYASRKTRFRSPKQWKKTLLDTNLRIPRDYKPWDLVSVKQANIAGSGKVRKKMIADLRALGKAARKAGKPLAVRSAWRSYDYQKALFDDGIPLTSLAVTDTREEHQRLLALNVRFTLEPTATGETVVAIFDDTCGNLIQMHQDA